MTYQKWDKIGKYEICFVGIFMSTNCPVKIYHPRSLARTFAARLYKQWVKRNLQAESQIPCPSEWLGMRS